MSTLINSHLIGQSIKTLRLNNHLTQDEVATNIGYSVRNIRRIETDGTSSIDVVNAFAEYYNVSAMDILNGCFLFIKAFEGIRKQKRYYFAKNRDLL